MQTFLPLPDFNASMKVLDPKRLGNQVYREALTLIRGGWKNHPASKMWEGHYHALALYALAGIDELELRGKHYPHHRLTFESYLNEHPNTGMPWWMGCNEFHASHRAALLYKDPKWYGKFGWVEEAAVPNAKGSLPYFWPLDKGATDELGRKVTGSNV